MKKLLFLILTSLFFKAAISQGSLPNTPGTSPRSNPSVVPEDYNLSVRANFYVPRFVDSASANTYTKFDTCGRVIFTYAEGYLVRFCSPKRWVVINGGGGSGITAANNGITNTAGTVGLDGTLIRNTTIAGANTYRMTFDGVSNFRVEASNGLGGISTFVVDHDSVSIAAKNTIHLRTNGGERMILNSSGNVGIGTGSPLGKLTVSSSGMGVTVDSSQGLILETSDVATSGNQKISPAITWIGKAFKAGAGATSGNAMWQAYVLPLQSGSTWPSTFILRNTLDRGINWTNCFTISNGALILTASGGTSGTLNGLNITGTGTNVYLGTIPTLSSGLNNTIVGVSALGSNTSGGTNVAIGTSAMAANTTGFSNVGIGVNNMLLNTTGFQNTSVGNGGFENATTPQENTGLGYDNFLNCTTCLRNVAIGHNAKVGTDGQDNVAIGYLGGAGVTAGNSQNVFVGYQAGSGGSQLGDADNTIAIGYGAFTTVDNSVVIGNSSMIQFDFWGALRPNGAAGTAGQVLTSGGAGVTPTWTTVSSGGITVGTTTITSGTNTRVGFNDSGVYGEDAGLVFNKTTDALTVGGDIGNPDIVFSSLGGVTRAKSIGTVQWYNPGISDAVHTWYKGDGSEAFSLSTTAMAFNTVTGTGSFNIQNAGTGKLGIGAGTPLTKVDVFGNFAVRQGADVASANTLALGVDGNSFEITGTTQINLITGTNLPNGTEITLLFTSNPTVKNGQATSGTDYTILLAGASDFSATAGDILTLVKMELGGTIAFREKSRSVN